MFDQDIQRAAYSPEKEAVIAAALEGIRTIERLTHFPEIDAETADFYAQASVLGIEAAGYRIVPMALAAA